MASAVADAPGSAGPSPNPLLQPALREFCGVCADAGGAATAASISPRVQELASSLAQLDAEDAGRLAAVCATLPVPDASAAAGIAAVSKAYGLDTTVSTFVKAALKELRVARYVGV